jgi:hypothetical protein
MKNSSNVKVCLLILPVIFLLPKNISAAFPALILVRAALCRRCLTAVGHYFSPSVAVQTVSDSRRPLFSIFFHLLVLTAVAKTPEGVVVGFQIFAWAPK